MHKTLFLFSCKAYQEQTKKEAFAQHRRRRGDEIRDALERDADDGQIHSYFNLCTKKLKNASSEELRIYLN
jgi:hypothetical protein